MRAPRRGGVDPPLTVRAIAGSGPTDLALQLLDSIHMLSGLPWWATIVTATFALRSALLPVALYSVRRRRRGAVGPAAAGCGNPR